MKTLRMMLLVTVLFTAAIVTAEPEKRHKGRETTPPPAAQTTRGPNQTGLQGQHPGQKAPQGWPMAPAPARGNNPVGPGRDQYGPNQGHGAPPPHAYGYGRNETPNACGPPQPSRQGPGQPPARDERDRPGERRDFDRGYAPPHPQAPPQRREDRDERDRREERDDRNRGRDNSFWRYAPLVLGLLGAFQPSAPKLNGAAIVGYDDTFLGLIIRDANDPDSVVNGWGRFGSPLSPDSIWNLDGRWGSRYAPDSPWNPYATRPPRVFDGDEFRGYLTANTDLRPRIDPEWLRSYLNLPRR